MKNLNEKERMVLLELIQQTFDSTGGEFGHIAFCHKCALTDNEFAGYISSLKKKGVFKYLNTEKGTYEGQYAIKEEYVKELYTKHFTVSSMNFYKQKRLTPARDCKLKTK